MELSETLAPCKKGNLEYWTSPKTYIMSNLCNNWDYTLQLVGIQSYILSTAIKSLTLSNISYIVISENWDWGWEYPSEVPQNRESQDKRLEINASGEQRANEDFWEEITLPQD